MATVNDVIRRAYRLAGIIGRTQEPSSEEYSGGLESLNELLDSWRAEDIDLGLYDVESSTEVPSEYVRVLRYCLAEELSFELGLELPGSFAQEADRLKAEIENPWIPSIEIDPAYVRRTRVVIDDR